MLENLTGDLIFAIRTLRKTPVFAVTAAGGVGYVDHGGVSYNAESFVRDVWSLAGVPPETGAKPRFPFFVCALPIPNLLPLTV